MTPYESSELPEFTPPKALELDGDHGEAMVKWRRKPNGNVCIVSMDGVDLSSEEDEETPEQEQEEHQTPMQRSMSGIDSMAENEQEG